MGKAAYRRRIDAPGDSNSLVSASSTFAPSSFSRINADAKDAADEQDYCNSVRHDRADHSVAFQRFCDDPSQRAVAERTAA